MLKQMRNERGGTLLLYTIAMVGMMGMAALAIDLGMLRKARAEAQRAADAAALAGASAFQLGLTSTVERDSAIARANRLAAENYMNGVAFDPATEVTVTVLQDPDTVWVTARRAAVPTWFARVFGLNSLPVGAKAAAVADYSGSAKCVQPLVFPDYWDEMNGDTNANNWPEIVNGPSSEDWEWEDVPGTPDAYRAFGGPGAGAETGLGSDLRNPLILAGETEQYYRDVGRAFVIKPANGPGDYSPSFFNLWDVPGGNAGGNDVNERIKNCDPDLVISLGTTYDSKPGSTQGPVTAGFRYLLNLADPTGARWVPSTVTVGGAPYTTGSVQTTAGDWRSSPRVLLFPLAHPQYVAPGRTDVQFNNFAYFWLESVGNGGGGGGGGGNDVIVRFIGPATGGFGGPVSGTLTKTLRLVK